MSLPTTDPDTRIRITHTKILADNFHLGTLSGAVPLPVGSMIQLGQPNRNAKVVGVRLWLDGVERDGEPTAVLCLDVEVSDAEGRRA